MLSASSISGARHYDRVLDAWNQLLGRNLHYGWFATGNEALDSATHALTDRMIDSLSPAPGTRVLDIGCGTGEPAFRLARARRCTVVGISPSDACIRQANARLPRELSGRVHFELGDAQQLSHGDQTFDAAWAVESSHLILDKERLFSEARRVLRPGGAFALCDVVMLREHDMPAVMARRDDFLLLHAAFGRAALKTPAYYARLAQRHGFAVTRQEDLTQRTAATFDRWRANAMQSSEATRRHIGQAGLEAFSRSLEILERLWGEGVLGYFQMSAIAGTGADSH